MNDFKQIFLDLLHKSQHCLDLAQGKCTTLQTNDQCQQALHSCFASYSQCYDICEQHLAKCHTDECKMHCLDVMKQSKLCVEELKKRIEECSISEKRCLHTKKELHEVFQTHITYCNKLLNVYCS